MKQSPIKRATRSPIFALGINSILTSLMNPPFYGVYFLTVLKNRKTPIQLRTGVKKNMEL
jgi:hypothetical protein